MKKKQPSETHHVRCWEFFHCSPEARTACLLGEVQEWRCWLVDIPCCRIDAKTPLPLSVKKVVCKTCSFFKTYYKDNE